MYDAPNHPKMTKDQDGKINRNIDDANSRTSLITDEVRVYKGGSWKDRAYWLDPAQRRYLLSILQLITLAFAAHVPLRSKK